MKKIIPIVVGLLLVGGVGFAFLNKSKTSVPEAPTEKKEGSVFTSIKDALSKSVSLECSFTDEAQGQKVTAFIKGGAVRSDFTGRTNSESGSAIIKDKKMYFWNMGKKEGMMIDIPDEKDTSAPADSSGADKSENILSSLEKYKNNCKAAVVADSLFTPPADVKFTNFSELMKTPSGIPAIDVKKYQNMAPQGDSNFPPEE